MATKIKVAEEIDKIWAEIGLIQANKLQESQFEQLWEAINQLKVNRSYKSLPPLASKNGNKPVPQSHSGDMGDCIAAGPALRTFGNVHLSLYPCQGKARELMTPEKAASLQSLLELQPYISKVEFKTSPWHDCEINNFRQLGNYKGNLAQWHLTAIKQSWHHVETAWLQVPDTKQLAPIVINRTNRYQGGFHWKKILDKYPGKVVFVGTVEEHHNFCQVVGDVPYYATANLLQVAQVIAGSEWFIGNASCCLNIAHGLKHPVIVECDSATWKTVYYPRSNAIYCWEGIDAELPNFGETVQEEHSGIKNFVAKMTARRMKPVEND
jgi:hypothetical protein